MINLLKKLFSSRLSVDFGTLIESGAVIVDVRTNQEYQTGHVKGSLNIPLNILESSISKLNKDKPVITCCASGMRSASAKNILKSNGFTEVYNGGSWSNLKQYKQ